MAVFKLKPTFFAKYFGRAEKIDDPNKDSEGKGTNERFQEMLADDWDTEMLPKIEKLLSNTLIPDSNWDRYIPYLEDLYGLPVLVDNMATRRKLVQNILAIYKVKGTLVSYQLLLSILGFSDVSISDVTFLQGFDSPVAFDDFQRRFDDSPCRTCSYYNLTLTGSGQMTEEKFMLIVKAVKLVEPINAKLYSIIYNEDEVTFTIFVANNGDLYYSAEGLKISFNLSPNGDLIVRDRDAVNYYLKNGDLIKKS